MVGYKPGQAQNHLLEQGGREAHGATALTTSDSIQQFVAYSQIFSLFFYRSLEKLTSLIVLLFSACLC